VTDRAYLHLVRSQVDAGTASVDVEAARSMPGVLDVLSFAEVAGQILPGGLPVLAERIQYQGQPVAAVIATSECLAADAAEAVDVQVHPSETRGGRGEWQPDGGHGHADELTAVVEQPRWHVAPLQTSQCVVEPVGDSVDLIVHAPARDARKFAQDLADVLGIAAARVRVDTPPSRPGRSVIAGDAVGAGHALAAIAALRLQTPIRWQETRAESLTSGGAEAAMRAVARVDRAPERGPVSLTVQLAFDVGAATLPSAGGAEVLQGLPWYGFGDLRIDEVERTSNLPPASIDASRVVGRVLAAESALMRLARVTGEPVDSLRDELATDGGAAAAALLATARAGVTSAQSDGRRASGFALAPGVAASVTIELDAGTGEWAPTAVVLAVMDDGAQNPAVVHALRAGAVDGYGLAAMQQILFDPQGTCLAATLMDYVMPSSAEAPSVEIRTAGSQGSPLSPNLARAVATAAVAAACRNAVTSLLPGAADLPSPLRSSDAWEVATA
jgi:CO/xanthine dehydrogenase Mo-binding subunit